MSASERRNARAAAAHATATAPARWVCHVGGCQDRGPHGAPDARTAELAAMSHYDAAHHTDPPADLEQQRAAWVAAGRPRFPWPSTT